jgi:hypothetical protein
MTAFSYLADYIPIRKELKFRLEGNIGIASDAKNFRVDYINESALSIFMLIDGKRSIADITQIFMKDFDVEQSIVEQDLVEILRNFQWRELITLKQNP